MAISAAIKAGVEIMRIYNDPNSDFGVERKSDNSPLTIADRAAHNIIVEELMSAGIYALSEEGKMDSYDSREDVDQMWIIDPLDGTKEFIKRNGEFTVNIALVQNGVPVMGVVYLPAKDILYFAQEELGSYRVDEVLQKIEAKSVDEYIERGQKLPLKQAAHDQFRVVASRSHLSTETQEFIDKLREEHGEVEFVSSGSSIKLALVAEGSADIYPRFAPTMEWDTAAGDAVARYAGAEVVRCDDELPLVYNKRELLNPYFIVRRRGE